MCAMKTVVPSLRCSVDSQFQARQMFLRRLAFNNVLVQDLILESHHACCVKPTVLISMPWSAANIGLSRSAPSLPPQVNSIPNHNLMNGNQSEHAPLRKLHPCPAEQERKDRERERGVYV